MDYQRTSFSKYIHLIFLLTPLVILSFSFCSQNVEKDGYSVADSVVMNGVLYEADLVLYTLNMDSTEDSNSTFYNLKAPKYYTDNGNLFTGNRTLTNSKTGEAGWKEIYEEGLPVKSVLLEESIIESRNANYILFTYRDGGLFGSTTGFDNNDSLSFRHENLDNGYKDFGPGYQLLRHYYVEVVERNEWHYFREWYQNGQLKFESSADSSGIQGYMTSYDELGNIIEQKLYKDDVLIENTK